MKTGASINPIEQRKPRSRLPQLGLALVVLIAFGTGAWLLVTQDDKEVAVEDWVAFESSDGRFKLKFPAEPDVSEQNTEEGKFVHLMTADMGTRVYAASYYDYDQTELDAFGASSLLDKRMQLGSESISGVITESAEMSWQDHPGREFWMDVPGGKAHYQIILVDRRLYSLAIIHMPSFEANHEAFFGSFELG